MPFTYEFSETPFCRCPGCNEFLFITSENFYRKQGKKSGFSKFCKKCDNARQAPAQKKWREDNLDKVRATQRRAVANVPIEVARKRSRAAYLKRRSAKAKVSCTFTTDHEQRALNYFNGCCAVCGRQLQDLFATHKLNWDHWIPITRGGHTSPDNMIPLCGGMNGCNNRKNNKLPDEWLRELYPDRKARTIEQRISAYFEWTKTQDDAS